MTRGKFIALCDAARPEDADRLTVGISRGSSSQIGAPYVCLSGSVWEGGGFVAIHRIVQSLNARLGESLPDRVRRHERAVARYRGWLDAWRARRGGDGTGRLV